MKSVLDRQGNELGSMRKQMDSLTEALKGATAKTAAPDKPTAPTSDYSTMIADVQKEIKSLDPMADGYNEKLAGLIQKNAALVAKEQHEKTLSAATAVFKQELDERDVKATHKAFLDRNPSFNTPEMQARIKEYLAKDDTGMADPLAAYYQIQRDETATALEAEKAEKADLIKRLELAEGKNKTGTVITKGQSPGVGAKPQKVTGKDLDAGMMAALQSTLNA
jgi:type II secretory pathway component GspD/PulD (secretin)